MVFHDNDHRKAFKIAIEKRGNYKPVDCYHASLLYLLTATQPTRDHLNRLYNFQDGEIIPESIDEAFQTGNSVRVTRLAFNLFNGFVDKEQAKEFSPYFLFESYLLDVMLEGVRLRYSPYFDPYLRGVEIHGIDEQSEDSVPFAKN